MSTTIALDPDKVRRIEPTEGDERDLMMLSSYARPVGMVSEIDCRGDIEHIGFLYLGDEDELPLRPLDKLENPQIQLVTGQYTGRITQLVFTPPMKKSDLDRVASRIKFQANATETPRAGHRLSYRMIASVIQEWGPIAFKNQPDN